MGLREGRGSATQEGYLKALTSVGTVLEIT